MPPALGPIGRRAAPWNGCAVSPEQRKELKETAPDLCGLSLPFRAAQPAASGPRHRSRSAIPPATTASKGIRSFRGDAGRSSCPRCGTTGAEARDSIPVPAKCGSLSSRSVSPGAGPFPPNAARKGAEARRRSPPPFLHRRRAGSGTKVFRQAPATVWPREGGWRAQLLARKPCLPAAARPGLFRRWHVPCRDRPGGRAASRVVVVCGGCYCPQPGWRSGHSRNHDGPRRTDLQGGPCPRPGGRCCWLAIPDHEIRYGGRNAHGRSRQP